MGLSEEYRQKIIKSYQVQEEPELSIGRSITCVHCGYTWTSKTTKRYITCNKCARVANPTERKGRDIHEKNSTGCWRSYF